MYQDENQTRNHYMVEKDTNMALELVNSIVDVGVAIQQQNLGRCNLRGCKGPLSIEKSNCHILSSFFVSFLFLQ